MKNDLPSHISRSYLTMRPLINSHVLTSNVLVNIDPALNLAISNALGPALSAQKSVSFVHTSYLRTSEVRHIMESVLASMPDEQKNWLFSDAMKEVRDTKSELVFTIDKSTVMDSDCTDSLRNLLPPLNLNAQNIVTFVSILIGILGILIPLFTSKEDEILQNQRELIHIEEQQLETLQEIQKNHMLSSEKAAHTMPCQKYPLQNNKKNEEFF